MFIQTVKPNTNQTVKSFEEMTEKTVDTKVAKANLAYANWKEKSYQQGPDLLNNVAKFMQLKKPQLAKTISF